MNNDSVFISTAILTALWEDTEKDNIELMTPFIEYIIHNKYSMNDEIDREYIISELDTSFSFKDFPHSILEVILRRMSRQGVLKRDNKEFALKKDLEKNWEQFSNRLTLAKSNTNLVLAKLHEYMLEEFADNATLEDAESYFLLFLETYGYSTYHNLDVAKTIDRKKDFKNYVVGEFICSESKKKSIIFENILKIIEGHMIANAIYLQIENDNKASLSKLCCYLDTTFLLKALGYKTKEENTTAKELLKLLTKYGASIKCFEHNLYELINIMTYYKNNINKPKNQTLEYFDLNDYTTEQVDMAINSLDSNLKKANIFLVDTPDYSEKNYKYVVDEKQLEKKLRRHLEKLKKSGKIDFVSENAITTDIKSVCSISKLRKGQKCTKIETCSHLFVTTSPFLSATARELVNGMDDFEIGFVLNDLDLTTILWFKDFSNNKNLPKLRLIENALAAVSPNAKIMKKTNKFFEDIKRDNLLPDLESVSNHLTSHYLQKSGYMKVIKGDIDNINKETVTKFMESKDEEIKRLKKDLENTKERNINNDIKLETIKENLENSSNTFVAKRVKTLKLILIIAYIITISILILISLYLVKHSIITDINRFFAISMFIVDVLSFLDLLLPRFNFIKKFGKRILKNYERDLKFKETQKNSKLLNK